MSKKKFLPFVVVALASIGVITGCSNNDNQNEQISVTDMLGETITITKNPKKVACISRTTYDLMVAYGLGDKIDGVYGPILENSWTSLIYPESGKPKKQFDYASRKNIPFISIIGGDEIASGTVNIKNLSTGQQCSFGKDEIDRMVQFLNS